MLGKEVEQLKRAVRARIRPRILPLSTTNCHESFRVRICVECFYNVFFV